MSELNKASSTGVIYSTVNVITAILMIVSTAVWVHRVDTLGRAQAACEGLLASAHVQQVEMALQIGAVEQSAYRNGHQNGYLHGLDHARTVREETEELARPLCDPMVPPYWPCCGDVMEVGGLEDVDAPSPDDFTSRRKSVMALWCARTRTPQQGAAWVCGRTEQRCTASRQRSSQCGACYVHLAEGAARHERFVWTGHVIDEVDGPWTADGLSAVMP